MIDKCEFWRYVHNGCGFKNPFCNQGSGAWVSSITTCNLGKYKQIMTPFKSATSRSSSSSSSSGSSSSSSI